MEISFSDKINAQSVKSLMESILDFAENNPACNDITIHMSSPGGDVELAIELYNFLKRLDCKVTIINTSYVSSAAVIVFLSGNERLCLIGSSFYIHTINKNLNGSYCISELKKEIYEMQINTDKILSILELETKKSKSYWRKLMNKGTVLTAKKAYMIGLTNKSEFGCH